MSRDPNERDLRKGYYNREWDRERDRDPLDRNREREYRQPILKRSRSPLRDDKRRSRSPRIKLDKDLDENILSEISKLPEPSELWEPNQSSEARFAPPPPSFQSSESNPSCTNYPASYSGIYDDFPPVAAVPPTPHPPDIGDWNQLSLPPPPTAPPQFNEDQIKKEAAIESEMRHQEAALSKQREDCMKKGILKKEILKKELETLKDQLNELRGDLKRSPSPDTNRFLKENTKLQLEIQNKLKTINNVVDIMNGIIVEEAEAAPDFGDCSPDLKSKRISRSPTINKFNYVYYDPEMHWCRVCNEFPPTAKDYLNHLHSQAHQTMAAAHMEAPWHSVTTANEGFPSIASAPTKRTPIRGLQFFVPCTAWYCKLCDQFIGDLHCASAHLKSIVHSKNYTNYVEQNPHWETDWMSDRQKAFEKARGSKMKEELAKVAAQQAAIYAAHTINKDGSHTKRKDSPPPPALITEEKQKKKKEERSSSSSCSSSSSSESEPVHKKKKKMWTANAEARLNESDRHLLESLKSRMTRDRDAPGTGDLRYSRERGASRKREDERRPSYSRADSRKRDGDRERRSTSRSAHSPTRTPEVRKMIVIGKMPIYKSLTNSVKTEEQKKKEDVKNKEEEEATKKRREEIQKKVAAFKEKIQQQLGPPAVALPTELGARVALLAPAPAPAPAPPPALPPPTPPPPPPSNPTEVIKQAEPPQAHQQSFAAAMPFGPQDGVMPPQMPPQMAPDMPSQMPPQMALDMPSQMPPQIAPDMPSQMPPQIAPDMPSQMPPQMPYQMPYQMPPQMPYQMPPQMPPQMPSPMPCQMPSQMHYQMPYQMPSQMPFQMPSQMPPGMMMPFNMIPPTLNPNQFRPRQQYKRAMIKKFYNQKPNKNQNKQNHQKNQNQLSQKPVEKTKEENGSVAKMEELDDLAMLDIDTGALEVEETYQKNRANKWCIYCACTGHYINICAPFLHLANTKRKTWVQKNSGCFKCLRAHYPKPCKRRAWCHVCESDKHHVLICVDKRAVSTDQPA